MQIINNFLIPFMASISLLGITGSVFNIEQYEDNYVKNNNNFSFLTITTETFEKIKPRVGFRFEYIKKDFWKKNTILSIQNINNNYLLVWENEEYISDNNYWIKYVISKKNLWQSFI